MTNRNQGFTLVEVVVVLAILAVIGGMAMPILSTGVDSQRRDTVRSELGLIGAALDDYYEEHGYFPASLRSEDFLGRYLQAGFGGETVVDPFGSGADYRFVTRRDPDLAVVFSIGQDRRDDGAEVESLSIRIEGSVPGRRTTRRRMRVVAEAMLQLWEERGRVRLDGVEPSDLPVGPRYLVDGFGCDLRIDLGRLTIRSDGPDRRPGTSDDIRW